MPLPFVIGAAAAQSITSTLLTYTGYGIVGGGTSYSGYVLANNVLDWLDPSREKKRNRAERKRVRQLLESMKDKEMQVVVDTNSVQTALEQEVVETKVSLSNITKTQVVLTDSTSNLTTAVDNTAEGAESVSKSMLIAEEKLRALRESMRQKDEQLKLMNERLHETQNALAEKDTLLVRQVEALEDTNIQLSEKVAGLEEAEKTITMLSAQKNDEMDAERQVVTSHEDTTIKSSQREEEIIRLNAMLVDANSQAHLLAQENEELRHNNQSLNNNYQALSKENNILSQDYKIIKADNQFLTKENRTLVNNKEMLIGKLVEANEDIDTLEGTIKSLEKELEVVTNSQPNQSSPKFFSK